MRSSSSQGRKEKVREVKKDNVEVDANKRLDVNRYLPNETTQRRGEILITQNSPKMANFRVTYYINPTRSRSTVGALYIVRLANCSDSRKYFARFKDVCRIGTRRPNKSSIPTTQDLHCYSRIRESSRYVQSLTIGGYAVKRRSILD